MTARELSLLSIANYDFLQNNTEQLKDFLHRGGVIRSIYVKPNGEAIKIVAAGGHHEATDRNPAHIEDRIRLSLAKLKEIAAEVDPNKIQVKFVDLVPSVVLTMVDHQYDNKIMFVTLNGFREPYERRPSFVLKDQDRKWFTFYKNCFENMWSYDDLKSEVSES